MKEQKKEFKTNGGITLIALVITIIVLLMLAGVSISMLTGDSSLLNQAANVKEITSIAQIEESINLAVIGALGTSKGSTIKESNLKSELNSYFGEDGYTISGDESSGWTVTVDDVTKVISNTGDISDPVTLASLKESGEAVSSNTTITDDNGDSITIPTGFNVASDSGTEVISGVVIEDSSDNQYVWIPVFEVSSDRDWGVDYSDVTSSTDYTNIKVALKTYTETYASSSYTDVWYGDEDYGYYYYPDPDSGAPVYYSNGNMTEDEYEELYQSMLSSIYTNGGFYIGRYEMGIDVVNSVEEASDVKVTRTSMSEYTVSSTNSSNTAPSLGSMTAPISKANAVAYTYITQSQAQLLAESLDYSSVTSSLMFGVQWDAVCVFIEKYDTRNGVGSSWLTSNTYSKLWGNYYNSTFEMTRGFYNIYSSGFTGWTVASEKTSTSEKRLCTTGASDQNSSLNIYDFAGNLWEWSLERSNSASMPCVYRGGYFRTNSSTSGRATNYTYYNYSTCTARASLWL